MIKLLKFIFLFFVSISPSLQVTPSLWAAPARPEVKKITLDNGMRLLLLERKNMPGIAFRIFYRVGSVDEEMGQSGLAHMFEHMAFKGTKTVNAKDYASEKKILDEMEKIALELNRARSAGASEERISKLETELEAKEKEAEAFRIPDEYEKIYEAMGVWGFNAFTSSDLTGYTISLPSNRLDAWLELESDRFQNGVLREFYRERNVVQEERLMRVESDPLGKLYEIFISNAYIMSPYQREVIGSMADLKRLTATQAKEFFETRYTPSRCVIAIVGDIDAEQTAEKVKRYFGRIPGKPDSIEFPGNEPPQKGERRVELVWDSEPVLLMGWHKPNAPHEDDAKLKLLSGVLDQGRTSRFYKNLIEKQGIATGVSAYPDDPGSRYPNLFVVLGHPRRPHDAQALEKAVEAEIEAIKKTPPEAWELERVRNNLEAQLINTLDENEGIAQTIAYNETIYGDWAYSWNLAEQFEKIKPEDLSEAARKYLIRTNKTVGFITKEEKQKS